MYKLAVDTVSLGTGLRFPAGGKGWSRMEFSLVSREQPAQGTVFGGAVRGVMPWGGLRGKAPPCTMDVLGQIPDAQCPLLLPFAVLRAHYPGSGCISSCPKINWQLNIIFLLSLSREMKLFMVLHVAEFVRKGYVLEIIAANSNFLCHLSM